MSWRRRLDRVRIEVKDETRSRQLSVIESALDRARRPERRHGRTLAIVIAIVLTVPVVALAAENAQPGDFLYPVRQILDATRRDDVTSLDSDTLEPQPATERVEVPTPLTDSVAPRQPEVPEQPPVTRPPVQDPPVTRPPAQDPPETRPRVRERPTTTSTTTTVPETTTTKPERTPPTKPPRDS